MANPVDLFEGDTGLVVPFPAVDPAVDDLRSLHDSSREFGVMAHVTVLFPFVPRAELTPDVEAQIGAIAASCPPFDVVFRRVGRFPGVVWLVPEPDEGFSRLTRMFVDRWPQHPPYGGEHPDPTPHLTVAEVADDEVEAIVEQADSALPIATCARTLDVLELVDGLWRVRSSFSLGS